MNSLCDLWKRQIDTREQLKNIAQLKVYKYMFKEDFAEFAGLSDDDRLDTGVLAQEVSQVLPDAVRETGDVLLPGGQRIDNFLVVNKVLDSFLFVNQSDLNLRNVRCRLFASFILIGSLRIGNRWHWLLTMTETRDTMMCRYDQVNPVFAVHRIFLCEINHGLWAISFRIASSLRMLVPLKNSAKWRTNWKTESQKLNWLTKSWQNVQKPKRPEVWRHRGARSLRAAKAPRTAVSGNRWSLLRSRCYGCGLMSEEALDILCRERKGKGG